MIVEEVQILQFDPSVAKNVTLEPFCLKPYLRESLVHSMLGLSLYPTVPDIYFLYRSYPSLCLHLFPLFARPLSFDLADELHVMLYSIVVYLLGLPLAVP